MKYFASHFYGEFGKTLGIFFSLVYKLQIELVDFHRESLNFQTKLGFQTSYSIFDKGYIPP